MREVVRDPLKAAPDLPFGHLNAAWQEFLQGKADGAELWSFSAQWQTTWGRKELRCGYVVVQDGAPGAHFLTVWKDIQEEAEAGGSTKKARTGDIPGWLRAHPYPPFLEHLSFRLGNQLFFVRVEDVDGKVRGPGNPRGFITAARMANGRACILPMKKKLFGGAWVADMPGWGLLDPDTRKPIDPVALVTDQKIEMTPWEVHDMAVQVVRDQLDKQGFELMSWQGNPEVDPSIWFIGQSKRPEWVVVRSAIFPANSAERPSNWQAIAASCAKMSATGHFASVAVVSVDQPFESSEEPPVPLWRGHGMHVRFTGLE